MRRLLLPLAITALALPGTAAAQKSYSCIIERPLADGTLKAETAAIEDQPRQPVVAMWVAPPHAQINASGVWLIDAGKPPEDALFVASYRAAPPDLALAPRFQLRDARGAILADFRPVAPDAGGTISFAGGWNGIRDHARKAGAIELVVGLDDGRVVARRNLQPGTLDLVDAGVAGAVKDLEPLVADPATRCTKTGDEIVVT